MERTYYTTNEAMSALRISRATLWKRINDGTLRSRLLGGKRLIVAADVDPPKGERYATSEEAEATR